MNHLAFILQLLTQEILDSPLSVSLTVRTTVRILKIFLKALCNIKNIFLGRIKFFFNSSKRDEREMRE